MSDHSNSSTHEEDQAYYSSTEDNIHIPIKQTKKPSSLFQEIADSPVRDCWFYPQELANDLQGAPLSEKAIQEILTCAWEYTRCVIPQYTNWDRYMAFARIIVIGTVAEFQGTVVDVASGDDDLLGYNLTSLLDTLFAGHPSHEAMAREYRTFLLITAEKVSKRHESDLFRRYVDTLVYSPRTWFRLRDCDALVRFTMAAALTCNDFDDVWFTEDELDILAELGDTLYDAVAFHKHRAEGETNSTFAYVSPQLREASFRRCREVLWALDVAWARSPAHRCILSFIRAFGGPIHMMMRRYRFIEDGLVIGKAETDDVVNQTRRHVKLWNRLDSKKENKHQNEEEVARYKQLIARSEQLMFEGLPELLEKGVHDRCSQCIFRHRYGAIASGQFGGVELCKNCQASWGSYVQSFPIRAANVFPVLLSI